MYSTTNSLTRRPFHKVMATLGLCVVGVLGNHLHIPLFFGVDFIFGSVAVLYAVACLGPISAISVAVVAGSYTYFLWGHPYAAIIFVAEAVFVYMARKKTRHLALADALFWLCLGIPLVILLYRELLDLPHPISTMVALKQAVNGVLNAAFAAGIVIVIDLAIHKSQGISLSGTLFNSLLVSILVPGIVLIAIETRRSKTDSERAIGDSMRLVAKFVDHQLFDQDPPDEGTSEPGPGYESSLSKLVDRLYPADLISVALLDSRNRVLAKAGTIHSSFTGEQIQTQTGVDVWLPPRKGRPIMVWWNNAYYIHQEPVTTAGDAASIIVEQKASPVVVSLHQRNLRAFLILFALTTFSILTAIFVSNAFSAPLLHLGTASQALATDIENGKTIAVPDSNLQEIKTLAESFGTMASSLSDHFKIVAERTKQLENLSNQLAKYLSPQIYDSIFSGRQEAEIKTERKKLTVCFTDLTGFTEVSSDMQPEDLTYLLNSYFREMSVIASRHGATIDKFIGDAIVIFFGDPESKGVSEDARACVRMAFEMQTKMQQLADQWRSEGLHNSLQIRIGINTGYCNVGNFGSEQRMDYTIIGAEVNIAARLEKISEAGGILLSGETFNLVDDMVDVTKVEISSIKGVKRAVRAYAVKNTSTA